MKKLLIVLTGLLLAGCSTAPQSTLSTTSAQETEQAETTEPASTGSSSAVVYFSATGNTADIARQIAEVLSCDIYEIEPTDPYTEEDLNYNNDNCRANLEQNDDSARPDILSDLSSIADYETIYLGYPIWWGTNPKIIQTFLETYDLSSKTIYTFCTSGGSGIETSISDLKTNYPALNIVEGKRFSATDDASVIQEWIESLSSH